MSVIKTIEHEKQSYEKHGVRHEFKTGGRAKTIIELES